MEQAPVALNKTGWDPRAQVFSTISVDKPWEQVRAALAIDGWPSVRLDKDGNVYFADPAASVIYKSDPSGERIGSSKANTNGAKALRVGVDGRFVCIAVTAKKP